MDVNNAVYVGQGLPALEKDADSNKSNENSNNSVQRLLDTAFLRRAHYTLAHTPVFIREQPSAAPSPVLRWLLVMQEKASQNTPASVVKEDSSQTNRSGKAPGVQNPVTQVTSMAAQPKATPVGLVVAPVAALARRGVGPKDPLQQRIFKKQQQQKAAQAAALPLPSAPIEDTRAPSSTTQTGVTPSSAVAASIPGSSASHWTRHTYAAMTATSWRVFREQLGITVELVAPASSVSSLATKYSAPANPDAHTNTPVMPPVDSLSAIRCWEEARLPYALGRCVTQTYSLPTAVQTQCVPLTLLPVPFSAPAATASTVLGMDVFAVAETGSGKTAAYLVPLLFHVLCRAPKLLGHPDRISLGPLSLVMVPTRELAEQVTLSLQQLVGQVPTSSSSNSPPVRAADVAVWEKEEDELRNTSSVVGVSETSPARNTLREFRVVKVVGGESREAQYASLAQGAHCVVGTVGQLHTLLDDRLLSLGNTQFVVMDEADRMLEEQQTERLIAVLERCPLPRQTLLYTATVNDACTRVARSYLSTWGYYLVRTPYRCASIRQSFELMSIVGAEGTGSGEATSMSDGIANGNIKGNGVTSSGPSARAPPRQQRRIDHASPTPGGGAPSSNVPASAGLQRRRLSPLLHPQKFARLVTWLVYGTGPIIVFANTKAICDVLFEELRAEATHVEGQQEHHSLTDLVGTPPEGLHFCETRSSTGATDRAVDGAHQPPQSSAVKPRPNLSNLTSVAVIHAELSQVERRGLVTQFQRRQRQVLLTTDLLARGLDVAGVSLVVNFDVPWSARPADAVSLYIHRIGRTGRAGSTGVSVSFIALPAPLVQRAEEVVEEEEAEGGGKRSGGGTRSGAAAARSGGAPAQGTASSSSGAPRVTGARGRDGRDEDPMSTLGELFDGDTNSVWIAGPAQQQQRGSQRGRHDASEEGEEEGGARVEEDEQVSGPGKRKPKSSAGTGFSSDVDVLRPLWAFLVACAEGEGCRDGAAELRHGTYAKINVPPALACIMAQLSATSQYGRITL